MEKFLRVFIGIMIIFLTVVLVWSSAIHPYIQFILVIIGGFIGGCFLSPLVRDYFNRQE